MVKDVRERQGAVWKVSMCKYSPSPPLSPPHLLSEHKGPPVDVHHRLLPHVDPQSVHPLGGGPWGGGGGDGPGGGEEWE